MSKLIFILLYFSALIMASDARASADVDFRLGMESFKSQNYQSAVHYFESSRKKGLNSVSLYYNLASSYYKIRNYSKARYYFMRVEKVKSMRSLARYNLGLIAVKQSNYKQARHYFEFVIKDEASDKLVILAKRQISKLDKVAKPWSIYLSANLGYDDNITSAPGETALETSDSFFDIFVSGDYVITGQRKAGWLVDASYFKIDYWDNNDFDEYQYHLGVRKEQRFSEWDAKIAFHLTQNNYAGIDYQNSKKLDLRARRVLSKTGRVYLRYRYEDISSESVIYDYLEGWRQRARIEFRDYNKKNIQQFYYELEFNQRNDLVATTYSYDYSPTRHTIRGKYTYILSRQWDLTGDLSFRHSDFPVSSSFDRDDKRWRLALLADYRIDKTLKIKTRLQFTNNQSSVDIYEYNKTLFSIGFSKLF